MLTCIFEKRTSSRQIQLLSLIFCAQHCLSKIIPGSNCACTFTELNQRIEFPCKLFQTLSNKWNLYYLFMFKIIWNREVCKASKIISSSHKYKHLFCYLYVWKKITKSDNWWALDKFVNKHVYEAHKLCSWTLTSIIL